MSEVTTGAGRRAVFFDRDGVLNRLVSRDGMQAAPQRIEDFHLIPDAARLVGQVRQAGFLAFVITNQPDIARGLLPERDLESMTAALRGAVPLDDVMICPHDDPDQCACRKPKPGMLVTLSERWNVDLKRSFVVGDSWKDIEAGQRVGCKTILLAGGDANGPMERSVPPDAVVGSLADAIAWVTERAEQ